MLSHNLLLFYKKNIFYFALWKHKMATNVCLDPNSPDDKFSRYDILSWINETLHTNFTQVEQCRSGTVLIIIYFLFFVVNVCLLTTALTWITWLLFIFF